MAGCHLGGPDRHFDRSALLRDSDLIQDVTMLYCPGCGFHQPDTHKYCMSYGTRLPVEWLPQQKLTQLFLGTPTHPSDPPEPVLRVSLYRREEEMITVDGSIRFVGQHARFSIWHDDRPECAMSLVESEARRLSRFVEEELHQVEEHRGVSGRTS